ncbi:hypothetical protein HKBW3S43_00110 [Candidatus Hakubella thermalkaliphila]|uniref:DUF6884 domain-containing protein n=1 Tax=Candidatus Hakubella thermalkaliphila TaxID=2754717 RepID=A0A6V8P5U3_9ACTN|nr:DUF6884 domain-containing protein [Candidatus Hakubella thermalkaliphila]MBT9169667.1 hypothetical protein [Bacillota bacterium]GFP27693.1 hypothetical protein HKBW3S33_01103 [Candidatus Hakubella thermalkaliphila]GFP34317.1 hypothetical protein HKBW3S43_00110 [Candidatus Hakubella thermalkaliphila]GFP43428.1 hypothetical protein HKBW3C_02558 [Candidatus Hakubella thermalkaliphila]
MKTLCIVPCGNRKIWDKTPNIGSTEAKDVYIGPFAKKCREYAEKFYPSSWCILSAKYGFLFPSDIVPGPYNVSFNDRKTNPITTKELSAQMAERKLSNYERIVILGGKNYVEMANEVFSSKEILTPLSDCKGIGYMMGKLNDSIKRGVPL